MIIKVRAKDLSVAMSEFMYRCYGTYGAPPADRDIELKLTTADPGNGNICSALILEGVVDKSSSWRTARSDSATARLEVFSSEDGLNPVLTFIESTRVVSD